jgi:hypothetical protein
MSEETNPFLRREARRKNLTNSHRRAPKQEKSLAVLLQAKTVAGSGCGVVKGDVRKRGIIRVEAKTTKHASFTLTLQALAKIEEAAVHAAEIPAMLIEFTDGYGRVIKEVAVVPKYILEELARG